MRYILLGSMIGVLAVIAIGVYNGTLSQTVQALVG